MNDTTNNTEHDMTSHAARMIALHIDILDTWGHDLVSDFQIMRDTGATAAEVVSLHANGRIILRDTDAAGSKLFRAAFM